MHEDKSKTYVYWTQLEYLDWELYIAATDYGLCYITLPNESFQVLENWVEKHIAQNRLVKSREKMHPYFSQLSEYFLGVRKEFTFLLDLRGTAFQKEVWMELAHIPYGHTVSYSEIASRIARPKAVRAVGAANGANPLPFVLPCHRVIGKKGALTGYRGGLEVKRILLQLESGIDQHRSVTAQSTMTF